MLKSAITIAYDKVLSLVLPRKVNITYVPGKYVKEFDGWRGVGITFVVLAHYFPSYPIGSWVFMEMFFVMSGFLITGILIDTRNRQNYFKSFILRRILRVFPLYYLSLIILFFLLPSSWLDLSYHKQNQIWFWLYIENWLFAVEGWPEVKAMSHYWSLAIEEQFYIMWPIVVWFFAGKNFIRFCIFLFLFSFVFRNVGLSIGFVPPFPYVATLGRMEGIVLGALIAALVRTNKSILEKFAYPVMIIAGFFSILIFIITKTMHMEFELNYMLNYTMVDLFFAGMIVLTLCSDELLWLKKIFNIPLIKTLGIMSYCIYIFHHPIHIMTTTNFLPYFHQLTGNEDIGKLICVLIAFIITVPVVYFIHRKIEVPLWKIKNKV